MGFTLLGLENILSDFFENHLSLSSDKDFLISLTDQTIISLQENIKEISGQKIAPNIFRVSLGETYQSESYRLELWSREAEMLIRQIVKENQLALHGPIIIEIDWNDLPSTHFQIKANHTTIQSGNTIRISSALEEKQSTTSVMLADLLFNNGDHYSIHKKITTIGRSEGNDLIIDNLRLSRQHARISIENGQIVLTDLGSMTGTFVNGNKIQRHVLSSGDVVTLGDVSMVFVEEPNHQKTDSSLTKKLRNE